MSPQLTDTPAATRSPGFGGVIVATKLHPPPSRPELVERARLLATLAGGGPRKLTVIEAPPGSGKTTLLAHWQQAGGEERPFAWLSLDEDDNDPAQFWTYVVGALRTVEPGIGAQALALLSSRRQDVLGLALPALINELLTLGRPVMLVLDDFHLITEEDIHEEFVYLLEHMPATLHVTLATRVAPQLRLARLRARGQLVHVRAGELRFSPDEAAALLAGLGLELTGADVEQLQQRTEGWAAGLYLAALSLRGRTDARSFIDSFRGDDRHLVDYLAAEVLESQPDEVRHFLLRTSVLRRLCAPLCDAVTGEGTAEQLLEEIERSNLFLLALDNRRHWYRYHRLFRELLAHELEHAEPQLVSELHRRASAWYREEDDVSEAIHHAAAAGDASGAADLIAANWNSFFNHGRLATVAAWLDALPAPIVERDRRLAVARAWLALDLGRLDEAGRWIGLAETGRGDGLEAEVSLLEAVHSFKVGSLGEAREAARRTVELEPEGTSFPRTAADCITGAAMHWSGEEDEAQAVLAEAIELARKGRNQLGAAYALGYRALIHAGEGRLEEAERDGLAALGESDEPGFAEHFVLTIAHLARAKALMREGHVAAADSAGARAVELSRRGAGRLEVAAALMALAEARHSGGDVESARACVREASELVERCPDPGMVAEALAHAERRLGRSKRSRDVALRDDLSDRELAVLRLLPSGLSQREIGGELFVSLNTVKSHIKSIYRKLGADSRADAVQRARELRLL
jgi:LuxR family transcriptional regulator, maltose regulon positive regulatory protein